MNFTIHDDAPRLESYEYFRPFAELYKQTVKRCRGLCDDAQSQTHFAEARALSHIAGRIKTLVLETSHDPDYWRRQFAQMCAELGIPDWESMEEQDDRA